MNTFTTTAQVRFAHVDPAGIVFYPRYFEMLNGAVEDWFALGLGTDFRTMHLELGIAVPTVKLTVEFVAPSRLGDELTITITPVQVGRSSCRLAVAFHCAGNTRLTAEVVLVCMNLHTGKSMPWPEAMRARMTDETVTGA